MLKNVSVRGEEFLLRSQDGKAWFASPGDLIDYRRRRSHEREKLRRDWDEVRAERRSMSHGGARGGDLFTK